MSKVMPVKYFCYEFLSDNFRFRIILVQTWKKLNASVMWDLLVNFANVELVHQPTVEREAAAC